MSVRQRKEILSRLCKDFADYSLPANLTYSGYITLVADPVLPRAIRKTYGNWSRAVKAVQLAKPELFAPKKPEPVVAPVKEPIVAQKKEHVMSAPTPKKPIAKPAVKAPAVPKEK